MARQKNAAALFEVFHGNKQLQQRENDPLRQPKWWLKKSVEPADEPAAAVDPNDPTTTPIKSPLIARRSVAERSAVARSEPAVARPEPAVARGEPARPAVAAPVMEKPAAAPSARPLVSSQRATLASRPAAEPARSRPAARVESTRSGAFEFDPERREIRIRASLPVAVATAFGLFCAVGMAYVMGRHEAPGGEIASTETVSMQAVEAPHRPLQSPVLDVSRAGKAARPLDGAAPRAIAASRAKDRDAAPTTPLANSADGMHIEPAAQTMTRFGPRTIGLNYVIAQSYPSHQTAAEARDFLVANGIPCTVERAPAGWSSQWFSVVTVQGFEHIHSEECENFEAEITRLGEKFAGTARIKRFEPMPIRWK